MNVIVYAIPVFLALMAVEYAVGVRTGRPVYRLNDAVGSLTAGILSQLSGVFMLALSVGIYIVVYERLSLFALSPADWRVWVGALIAYDFLYYWNHRIDHEVGLFWAAHVVHHQSDHFNLSTALRQSSTGSLLGWIFYLPMAVAGVPPVVFVGVGLIDLLYQFWIHTELVGRLGWFDRVFASPSNHRVHHGINDRYLDKNYGGILILWDRLFGTFEPETETPVFGVRGGLATFDPVGANLAYYRTMADLCRRAESPLDRLRVWFAPPGWVPANLRPNDPPPPFDLAAVRPYDPPAGPLASGLAFAALVAMIGATAAFLAFAPGLPLPAALAVFAGLVATLWAVGAVLDGGVAVLEALFVFAAAVTSAASSLGWPLVEGIAKPLALLLLIASVWPRPGKADVKRLVLAALAASLVGDVLLIWPSLFLPGLVAFLVAQALYVLAFLRGPGFLPSRVAAAAVALFALGVLATIWGAIDPALRAPVAAYVAMLSLMVAQAAGRATVLQDRAATLVAVGAGFFMLSDLTLALTTFGVTSLPIDHAVLPTYYLAQGLIAFFILPRGRRHD